MKSPCINKRYVCSNRKEANPLSSLLHTLEGSEGVEKSNLFYLHLKKTAREKGIPLYGTFELTPRCTLDCAMCYVHLKPGQMHRSELTTKEWIDLSTQASQAGMLQVNITGGECILHPGCKDIIQHLLNLGVSVSIFTNGTLIDEQWAQWIAERPIELVQISVYGSSPEAYQTVTGSADAFYRVDHAIDLLKAKGIRLKLVISTSTQLLPDFEALYAYCASKDPTWIELSPNPFPAREETGRKAENYRMNVAETVSYYRMFRKARNLPPTLHEPLSDAEMDALLETVEGVDEIPIEGVLCGAGSNTFAISWDGFMNPCNALYWMKANPLTDGFAKAWEQTKASVKAYRYPAKCKGCKLRRACTICPGLHYKSNEEPSVLNPNQCNEVYQLVQQGLLHT